MDIVLTSVLEASFRGSIVIAAVLLLRLLLKRAPKSLFCLLWLLAGLRLVLPFEVESIFSLQPRLETAPIVIEQDAPVQIPDPGDRPIPDAGAVPENTPQLPEGNWSEPENESHLYSEEEEGLRQSLTFTDIAAPIWLLGMGVMLSASLISYLKLRRRVSEACRTPDGCWECAGLETAFVLGFVNPRIYLPGGLSGQERAFILEHENTHIARRDHLSKLLGYLILCVHWFNPLVWLGYHLLCRDMELACDEHVVKHMDLAQRKAYSGALLTCGSHTSHLAACPVAFGEASPKRRILNVLHYKKPTLWIMVLTLAAVIFVAVCLLTSPTQTLSDETQPESPMWNLTLSASDVSPSGMQLEFHQEGSFPGSEEGSLIYGNGYVIQVLRNGQWEDLALQSTQQGVTLNLVAHPIELNNVTVYRINWQSFYGQLAPGHYRISIAVSLFRGAGDADEHTFFAEFTVPETAVPETQTTPDTQRLVQQCRDAMEKLKNAEELYLYIENIDDPNEVRNTYIRTARGWLFQYRRPLWDYQDISVLHYDGKQYVFTGTHDEDGVVTAPYYWQTERDPGGTVLQLPYPFDLDWNGIVLGFVDFSTEDGWKTITLTFPDYLDVFTFTFDQNGNLVRFDVGDSSGEPEATTSRFYVASPWGEEMDSYLEGLAQEAAGLADRKPQPLNQAAYTELFTRVTDGHYTTDWIEELFAVFYQDPEEFVSQLAALNQKNPDAAGNVLTHMSNDIAFHAPLLFEKTVLRIPDNHHPEILEQLQMMCPGNHIQQEKDEIAALIDANAQLAKCNTALHNYKSQGAWCLVENNFYSGGDVLNTSSDSTWYIRGSNYLCHTRIHETGGCSDLWSLCNDHTYHHRLGFTSNGPEFGDSWVSEWNVGVYDNTDIQKPWPLWFNWSTADLNYMETTADDSFESIRFWTLGDPTGRGGAVQKYTVTFRLNRDGSLQNIRLNYLDGSTEVEKVIAPREITREEVDQLLLQHHTQALSHTAHHEEDHHDDHHG